MKVWKIIFLSKWAICRFHVNLPGCTSGPADFGSNVLSNMWHDKWRNTIHDSFIIQKKGQQTTMHKVMIYPHICHIIIYSSCILYHLIIADVYVILIFFSIQMLLQKSLPHQPHLAAAETTCWPASVSTPQPSSIISLPPRGSQF